MVVWVRRWLPEVKIGFPVDWGKIGIGTDYFWVRDGAVWGFGGGWVCFGAGSLKMGCFGVFQSASCDGGVVKGG